METENSLALSFHPEVQSTGVKRRRSPETKPPPPVKMKIRKRGTDWSVSSSDDTGPSPTRPRRTTRRELEEMSKLTFSRTVRRTFD